MTSSSSSSSRLHQRGGDVIGKGHDGNIVYTMDDLVLMFPSYKFITLESEFDADIVKTVSAVEIMTTYEGAMLQQSIALKHVADPFEAAYEVSINGLVRRQFEHAGLLPVTVLHPMYDVVRVLTSASSQWEETAGNDAVPKELVYKRMLGSVTHFRSQQKQKRQPAVATADPARGVTPHLLISVARSVLAFLCVVHVNGYLHMDVKPDNILYDLGGSGGSGSRGTINCVLADYGLITPMADVFKFVKKKGSFYQGTSGYISPLLTRDDEDNRVYAKFTEIVQQSSSMMPFAGGGTSPQQQHDNELDAFWFNFFEHQKRRLPDPQALAKTDLQSLALTLHSLRRHCQEDAIGADVLNHNAVVAMIPRLLLHGSNTYDRAADALRDLFTIRGIDIQSTDPDAYKAVTAQPLPPSYI